MRKLLLVLFAVTAISNSSSARASIFNIKELITLSDHNIDFFNNYVTGKGYSYERSKYDEKNGSYSFVLLSDIQHSLHEITYNTTPKGTQISFSTTDTADYERLKQQVAILNFTAIEDMPQQKDGRPVEMTVYTDGHIIVHLSKALIENNHHRLVNIYTIRVTQP